MKIVLRANIEILGKPETAVTSTLENIAARIEKRNSITLLKKKIEKLKKEEQGFFSSSLEVEVSVEDFSDMVGFILDFGPINIEILEPENISFDSGDIEEGLNQLLGKFHDFDNKVKILAANLYNKNKEKKN